MDAKELYTNRKRDIAALFDWLSLETDQHERYAKEEGGPTWAEAGDLGHVRELLVQTLAFLAQREEKDIEDALPNANMVDAEDACPRCGERHADNLVWQNDETVHCTNCGTRYQPHTHD